MERKLVITTNQNQIQTSVFENNELVEINCCSLNDAKDIELGDIYIGKVSSIVKNIGAAFISVSKDVECYYDIASNTNSIFVNRVGNRKNLTVGDELLVQIQKEGVKSKVPTVTGHLSIPGRYVVLTTGDCRPAVSAKLSKKMRKTWVEVLKDYCTEEYGFIVRTNSRDADMQEVEKEIASLAQKYEKIRLLGDTRPIYTCIMKAPSQYLVDIRNSYQNELMSILVEDPHLFEEIHDFLTLYQPNDLHKLMKYEDTKFPLHKLYSLDTAIEKALKERVWLKSGAYLVIQQTEALTVVDVNTGKALDKKEEGATLSFNIEAALETAKQIRLRNLSGIIIVDFVNMRVQEDIDKLLHIFEEALRRDPVPTTLVGMTKLQLVEVTRKKVRKPLAEKLTADRI